MTKEFNLSEKIWWNYFNEGYDFIEVKDISEFIRRLKEEWEKQADYTIEKSGNPLIILNFKKIIDKLAGEEFNNHKNSGGLKNDKNTI